MQLPFPPVLHEVGQPLLPLIYLLLAKGLCGTKGKVAQFREVWGEGVGPAGSQSSTVCSRVYPAEGYAAQAG